MIMHQTRGSAGQSSHQSLVYPEMFAGSVHLKIICYSLICIHQSSSPLSSKSHHISEKTEHLGPLSSTPNCSQGWGTTEQTAAGRAALGAAKRHKVKQQLLGEHRCLQQDGTGLGCTAVSLPLRALGLRTNQHTLHQPRSATVLWHSPGTGALRMQLKKGPRASVWPGFLQLHSQFLCQQDAVKFNLPSTFHIGMKFIPYVNHRVYKIFL